MPFFDMIQPAFYDRFVFYSLSYIYDNFNYFMYVNWISWVFEGTLLSLFPSIILTSYLSRLLKSWTEEEVKIATGNSERHLVVHPLKLNSSYATVKVYSHSIQSFSWILLLCSEKNKISCQWKDIVILCMKWDLVSFPFKWNIQLFQGSTNTRGFNGEPLATSYHSKFLGTVDYLW